VSLFKERREHNADQNQDTKSGGERTSPVNRVTPAHERLFEGKLDSFLTVCGVGRKCEHGTLLHHALLVWLLSLSSLSRWETEQNRVHIKLLVIRN
jgi:hypothetical protein